MDLYVTQSEVFKHIVTVCPDKPVELQFHSFTHAKPCGEISDGLRRRKLNALAINLKCMFGAKPEDTKEQEIGSIPTSCLYLNRKPALHYQFLSYSPRILPISPFTLPQVHFPHLSSSLLATFFLILFSFFCPFFVFTCPLVLSSLT